MANLRFCDKHNMVAFLKKPTKSEGFTEATATVRTLANETQQIEASIDNKPYTITKASVRSKLQLADAAGISNLPDADIYAGLATLGPKSGGWDQFGSPLATALICLSSNRIYNFSKLIFEGMVNNIESTSKFFMYPIFLQMVLEITTSNTGKYLPKLLTKKLFANMKRGYVGDFVPLLPAMLAGAAQDTKIPQSQGPTPTFVADEATSIGVEVDTEGATTTTSGLDASVEDSVKLQELMNLAPQLQSKIGSLEKELKDTKQTFGQAILTLVERVKTLEVALKRKSKKVVLSDSEEEETEAQGRKIKELDDDPLVSLVKGFVTPSKTSGEEQVEDKRPTTLEAAKTLSKVASQKPKSVDKGRRYKRRKESKEKKVDTGLDFEDIGFENISSGFEDISTGFNDDQGVNTGSIAVSTGSGPVSTDSIRVSIPSPDKGQREGKAPIIIEETQASKKTKEQIL
ncbi:hypothetical protein Tco_1416723, partial [Tanacetum coccineum]